MKPGVPPFPQEVQSIPVGQAQVENDDIIGRLAQGIPGHRQGLDPGQGEAVFLQAFLDEATHAKVVLNEQNSHRFFHVQARS